MARPLAAIHPGKADEEGKSPVPVPIKDLLSTLDKDSDSVQTRCPNGVEVLIPLLPSAPYAEEGEDRLRSACRGLGLIDRRLPNRAGGKARGACAALA